MTYSFRREYMVRYDECSIFNVMTPAAILRYLQDIAVIDAEQAELMGTGNWVAKRTVIECNAPIEARAKLEIETYPLGFTKVTAQRGYFLRLAGQPDSEPLVKARTLWVYLDERGRPARITPEMLAVWIPPGTPAPTQLPETDWPAFPADGGYHLKSPVKFSELDVLGHMNNAAYVELLDDTAWQIFGEFGVVPNGESGYPRPLHYDIEYIASALPGDVLEVDTWFQATDNAGEFEQLQRVRRGETLLVKARSRWYWQPNPEFWQGRLY